MSVSTFFPEMANIEVYCAKFFPTASLPVAFVNVFFETLTRLC